MNVSPNIKYNVGRVVVCQFLGDDIVLSPTFEGQGK